MRAALLVLSILIAWTTVTGQNAFQELVDTERAFAKLAAEKGAKHAFLEYSAPDAYLFLPAKVNAREYWKNRGEMPGLLAWAPNFANVSASGTMGYTTGNWEYRPKGMEGDAAGFGQFATVWVRQPDGKFRFAFDIGIDHPKPANFSEATSGESGWKVQTNDPGLQSFKTAKSFMSDVSKKGNVNAYAHYVADDVRLLREGQFPIIGKKAALDYLKNVGSVIEFKSDGLVYGTGDMSYVVNEYTETKGSKSVRGNYLQIWQLRGGKWQIVLDVFKPVPDK